MPRKKSDIAEATENASVKLEDEGMELNTPAVEMAAEAAENAHEIISGEGFSIEADAEEVVSDEELDEENVVIGDADVIPAAPAKVNERMDTTPARRVRQSRAARNEERARQAAEEQSALTDESSLRTAIQRRTVRHAPIVAVEEWPVGDHNEIFAVALLNGKYKVIIPFSELFKKSPMNMENVDLSTSDGRYEYMRRTRQFAERMIGGDIPLCLTAMERDGDDIILLGSRARAMEQESRRFFGGKSPRYNIGDVVTAKITSVNVHSVVVMIGGVDVVIPQHRLTRRWFLDLHDGYKVGDEIRAVLTEINDDPEKGISIVLDPVRVELADARNRYNIIKNNGRTKGIITNVIARRNKEGNRTGMAIYAYLPSFDLFARVIRLDANSFGRQITTGTQVMLRVIDHHEDGYLICEAMYDHGNNSMFNSYLYR